MKELKGAYFQDPDCLGESINIFDVRIKDVFKVQMISKILFCNSNGGQPNRSFIVIIKTNRNRISVTVNNLLTSKTVFCLKLYHVESNLTILPNLIIRSLDQVRSSLIDAIGLLNTQHIAEEAAKWDTKDIDSE